MARVLKKGMPAVRPVGATAVAAPAPAPAPAPAGAPEAAPEAAVDGSQTMTAGTPSEPMRQAYRDVTRGLQDTDRGAEAGRTYRKLKR